jgi:uncharacterized membrane protein YphA (DoxX/SURF4 family)
VTDASKSGRGSAVTATVISTFLCVVFAATGLAKLTSQPMVVAEFALFGIPTWFMDLTGVLEVAAAVLVVIPRTSRIGAALIICILACAIVEHVTHGQASTGAAVFVLLLIAVALVWLRGGLSTPLLSASAKGTSLR